MRSERGQTSSELMMAISVIVIGVVAAAWVFVPSFSTGVYDLSNDVSMMLSQNGSAKGGFGMAANNASGGGYDPTKAQQSSPGTSSLPAKQTMPGPVCQADGSCSQAPAAGYDPNANAGE